MTASFRVLRLFGTEIKIHWSLPLGVLLFLWTFHPATPNGMGFALALIGLLFISITLHEIGHALVARSFGISTSTIVLWPLGGLALFEKRPLRMWQDIAITLAGPLTNLALAGVVWGVLALWNTLPPLWSAGYNSNLGYVQIAGDTLVYVNIALALFNLVPAYPLDGGQVLRRLLDGSVGARWTLWLMLPLSLAFAAALLAASVVTVDPLLGITALFIGLGAMTISPAFNQRLNSFAARMSDRGFGYIQSGDPQRAIEHYDRVIPRKPPNAWFYNNRGYAYALTQHYVKAIADYDRALAINDTLLHALINRGNAYRALGDFPAALRDYTRVLTLNPNDADANHLCAIGQYYVCDLDQALDHVNRAIELDGANANYFTLRSLIFSARSSDSQTDQQRALDDANRILEIDPKRADGYNNRGYIRFLGGNVDGAMADYTQGLALTQTSAHLYSGRAEVYAARSQVALAIADYTRAIELDPRLPFAHVRLAQLAFSAGDKTSAATHLSGALAAYTSDVLVLSPRELSFYVKGALDWMLFVCRCAAEQRVAPALVQICCGDAYRVNEQHEQAVRAYTTALDCEPATVEALLGRALSQHALGNIEATLDDLDAVQQLSDNHFYRRCARELAELHSANHTTMSATS